MRTVRIPCPQHPALVALASDARYCLVWLAWYLRPLTQLLWPLACFRPRLLAYCIASGLIGATLGLVVLPIGGTWAALAAWAGTAIIAGLARE
jgi:hypothetical protein